MISPSRRKRPITLPSTPTFASAGASSGDRLRHRTKPGRTSAFAGALAGLALLAAAAAPLSAQETLRRAQPPLIRPSASPASSGGGHAPSSRFAEPAPSEATAPPTAARPKASKAAAARPATSKINPGALVAAPQLKKPARAIRPANFEEVPGIDAADILPGLEEPVPQIGAVADNATRLAPSQNAPAYPVDETEQARRERLRSQLTRPFKQIKDIHPFYDYEPDAEQLAQDRCFNLCPRPGSPDCPDCDRPTPEGAEGRMPCPECPIEIDLHDAARIVSSINDYPTRNFPHMDYCWEPTNLYAYPLYFEDFALERYGHTRHYLIQAPFSVGLFAAQFIGLPYQITIDPIAKKRYALGWYRPGQYVPYKYYQVPWNTEAALVEAGVIAGSTFLWAPSLGP